jgi:hypothetical protein
MGIAAIAKNGAKRPAAHIRRAQAAMVLVAIMGFEGGVNSVMGVKQRSG